MTSEDAFEIRRYDFTSNIFNDFQNLHRAKDFWPIVYILSDKYIKEAYVGETTDTYSRMANHLKNDSKKKLSAVHLIMSGKFNKSATLDIESNLIKYISGDGKYKLMNANVGLANHNYYQKKEYWNLFKDIWNRLRAEGVVEHAIEYIDNSDLFKYSPYKSLSPEQKTGLLTIMKALLHESYKNIIVEGGAGTGKTVMAIFLFKLLHTNLDEFNFKEFGEEEEEFVQLATLLKQKYPLPKTALVVPMSSFRKTLKKVFKNIKGLSSDMVIGPAELAKDEFDLVLVDESHRLRRRVNLGTYYRVFDSVSEQLGMDKYVCNELDWVLKQTKTAVLFYDPNQSIKPSDTPQENFDKLKTYPTTGIEFLKSQLRVKGGNDYIDYVTRLLDVNLPIDSKIFNTREYEFVLFDSIDDFITEIKQRNEESGLSRMIAGYAWPWVSNKNSDAYDIKIENTLLKWNSVTEDWINSPNSVNEVGCIHTTQAYDLNYAGVIFGNEIAYDKQKGEIVILKDKYHDKNGKQSIKDATELKKFVLNIYKTIMMRGIKGTYVYVCNPDLRDYFQKNILPFKPIKKSLLLPKENVIPFVNSIPLYNLRAAAGNFSEQQQIDLQNFDWVQIPASYKPSKDLFACIVKGESMDKIIPDGSLCLFRKYVGGSRNGKIVLVEHGDIQDPDFGMGYTVKEYQSIKKQTEESWAHISVILRPRSNNPMYKDILLTEDETHALKVIGIFECVL